MADNGNKKGITLLMCNPSAEALTLLQTLAVCLCEVNHTGRRAKVAITLPVKSPHTHAPGAPGWPVGADPRQHGALP